MLYQIMTIVFITYIHLLDYNTALVVTVTSESLS